MTVIVPSVLRDQKCRQMRYGILRRGILCLGFIVFALCTTGSVRAEVKYAPGKLIVKYKEGVDVTASVTGTTIRALQARHKFKGKRRTIRDLDENKNRITGRVAFLGHLARTAKKNLFEQTRKTQDFSHVPSLHNIYTMEFDDPSADMAAIAEEYAKDPNIEYASPDYVMELNAVPNDTQYGSQWALPRISAPQAWDIQRGNNSVTIAIIDTGVDWNHPDLAANVWQNVDETAGNSIDDDANTFVDDVRGWDFVDPRIFPATSWDPGEYYGPPNNNPMDFYGHGTLVAGVAAAVTNNAAGVSGAGWNVKVMPLRVGIKDRVGNAYILSEWVTSAVYYAANNGADVINLSLTDNNWTGGVLKDAVDYAYARGAVIVASAGNHGESAPTYPAAYSKVMGVASTDQNDVRAVWGTPVPPLNQGQESNYGSWVKVAAPGTSILSTGFNDTYASSSGTSMSAPFVASLAALIRAQHPGFTNAQIMKVIASTTDTVVSDKYIGTGRINMARALAMTAVPVAEITAPLTEAVVSANVSITGSAGGTNFAAYTLQYGPRYYPASLTTIQSSTTPVTNGVLGTWDISSLQDNMFYTLRLSVTDTAGNKSISEIILYVQKNVATGWPQVLSGTLTGEGVSIGDVDNDGDKEVAVVTMRSVTVTSKLYDLNLLRYDGSQMMGWPVTGINAYLSSAPTLADLTGSGELQVIISGYSRATGLNMATKFHVFDRNGSYFPGWPQTYTSTHGFVMSTPSVGDLDNDGIKEIVFTSKHDGKMPQRAMIFVFRNNGTAVTGWPQSFDLGFPVSTGSADDQASHAVLVDLDHDGNLEIVVGLGFYGNSRVYAFHHDGTVVSGWPRTLSDGFTAKPVAGDIDNDGNMEIIGTTGSGYVHCWEANGTACSGFPVQVPGGYAAGPAVLADLDVDGDLEIVIHTTSDQQYVYHHNGTVAAGWPVAVQQITGGASWPAPLVGDIDGDNAPEVIQASADETYIYAWHANGSVVTGWPKIIPQATTMAPALGDIDNDGSLEMAVGYGTTLNLWEMATSYRPRTLQCPMSWFDKEHTGVFRKAVLYGDISGDGNVSAIDAVTAMRYAVGLVTLTSAQITKGDVNGDTRVTIIDAQLILRYAVGLIAKFPVEK